MSCHKCRPPPPPKKKTPKTPPEKHQQKQHLYTCIGFFFIYAANSNAHFFALYNLEIT